MTRDNDHATKGNPWGTPWGWSLLVAANVLAWGVLGLVQHTTAQNPTTGGQPPFASALDQRQETIKEIRETNALLREQIALLKSGKLQVVVEAKK